MPGEPDRRRDRQRQQIVLDQPGHQHQQAGRDDVAGRQLRDGTTQQQHQRGRGHGVGQPLRIAHGEIVPEHADPVQQKQRSRRQRPSPGAGHDQHGAPDAGGDGQVRHQRYQPQGDHMVADQRSQSTDDVERQRRVVVGNQGARRWIQVASGHRDVGEQRTPALVVVALDVQRQQHQRFDGQPDDGESGDDEQQGRHGCRVGVLGGVPQARPR